MITKEPGYVYILTNPSFREDWVKIGMSCRPVINSTDPMINGDGSPDPSSQCESNQLLCLQPEKLPPSTEHALEMVSF